MSKLRLATVWLDGCSGCHMSFLDIDERLLDLAEKAELVYSPLVDAKEFPDEVDVTLVEGAVATDEDLEKIRRVRAHTKVLVSLGDCAVTSNVPGMRNPVGLQPVISRSYGEALPAIDVPKLLERVLPVHQVVDVDVFVPGCPPSADTIYFVLAELLEGRHPELVRHTRFGA
jgi:NAD-reducing hydrogenase small subunit